MRRCKHCKKEYARVKGVSGTKYCSTECAFRAQAAQTLAWKLARRLTYERNI